LFFSAAVGSFLKNQKAKIKKQSYKLNLKSFIFKLQL